MITVLLPTYNSEKYISQAIKSILNQTLKDFEFLIIDDGSKDNTERVVKSFKDKRIKYFKKEHTGLADTLNYGLKIAKHDWVARMDADDISHPQRLELQMNYLSEHKDIDWISCWYAVFDNKLRYKFKLPEFSDEIVKNLVLSSSICFPGSIFRKNKIIKNNGFKREVFEDYDFFLRAKNQLRFYNVQEILYFQRKRSKSLSRKDFEKTKNIIYNIQAPYFPNLKSEFNLKNDRQIFILKGWREFLYGNKNKCRDFWNNLGIYLLLNPKIILMYILTFLSEGKFKNIRKIGFKFLPFYSHLIPFKEQLDFKQVLENLNE